MKATILALLFASLGSAAQAGFMDQSDCLNGPVSFRSGLEGVLDELSKRVVACFNYSESLNVERHNDQAADLRRLQDEIDRLSTRVQTLEYEMQSRRN